LILTNPRRTTGSQFYGPGVGFVILTIVFQLFPRDCFTDDYMIHNLSNGKCQIVLSTVLSAL